MDQKRMWFGVFKTVVTGGALGIHLGTAPYTLAQIVPDATLGHERSLVRGNMASDRGLIDRIDGGAIRGGNLFHSFSEFNVGTGQRVYFSNPDRITNIISRVTGRSHSDIDGTLGVLGNANLFLINPNGIVFGPNAQLDVNRSFVASTADSVLFPDGFAFSATNPTAPPLVTINSPLGLDSWLPTQGAIATHGTLRTGQDLTLAGRNLDVQGQLQAGGSLNLLASDAIAAHDSVATPLILSAANQVLLQGQSIDLAALSHPDSGLFAGGDMVWRSPNPINGDIHVRAGGNFSIQQPDGRLGTLRSKRDPVFEVAGNFSLDSYTGASLQILAGGSVTIPGEIVITGAGGPFNDSRVTLSDGTPLTVTGTTQPTLDIRAGTTRFFGTPTAGTPTRADIRIGSITNHGGLVLLTNQFQPNSSLSGNITVGQIDTTELNGGGTVAIDSRDRLSATFIDASGGDRATSSFNGNGGDVRLLADGDIRLPFPSFIYSDGLLGGTIALRSNSAIRQEDAPLGTPFENLSVIESQSFGVGTGGDMVFAAPTISFGGLAQNILAGEGQSGRLIIRADDLRATQGSVITATIGAGNSDRTLVNANSITLENGAVLGSLTASPVGGNAGDVEVHTDSLTATSGGQLVSFAQDLLESGVIGNAGNVRVIASNSISLSGTTPDGQLTGISSTVLPGVTGNAGTVTVQTGSLSLRGGAQIRNSTLAQGNAGPINVTADDVSIDGAVVVQGAPEPIPSAIVSEVLPGSTGQGNNIRIATRQLSVTNGGFISASTAAVGNAGNIDITATDSATFDGAPGRPFNPSGAFVGTLEGATGRGGRLTITTPNLSVLNGAQLEALTENSAPAGDIRLNVSDSLLLDGRGSGILANTSATSSGDGGSIRIGTPQTISVRNGARIAVNSDGTGRGGDIEIQARSLALDNRGVLTAETTSNTGGNITLRLGDVLALRRNSQISSTAGTASAGGDGGNITINAPFVAAALDENSDITANAFTGRGGRVTITANSIFGLIPRSRLELETLLNTNDPAQLNPANLPTSDITAISQANPDLSGEVVIQTPDTNPIQGATNLPANLVDASRLIAQGCSAGQTLAQRQGSLIVTGRGGLPPSPTDQLREDNVLVGWESFNLPTQTTENATSALPSSQVPGAIAEAQSLKPGPDGRMILTAQAPGGVMSSFWNRPAVCTP